MRSIRSCISLDSAAHSSHVVTFDRHRPRDLHFYINFMWFTAIRLKLYNIPIVLQLDKGSNRCSVHF
jgi:hypothetical protein